MSWLDLVLLVLIASAARRGYRSGAIRQIGATIGFAAGFVVGVLIAPPIATSLSSSWRGVIAIALVLVIALVGLHVGRHVAGVVRRAAHLVHVGTLDSSLGLAISVASTLVAWWLIAGLLAASSWTPVASAVQDSAIVRAVDRVMPPVPQVEARVQSLLNSVDFPNVFASVIAPTLPSTPLPSSARTLATLGNENAVVKVEASGCSSAHEGTGFVVAHDEVVTNAHVVAGATSITAGGQFARVLVFDPETDLAVLDVPTGDIAPLALSSPVVAAGTPAGIVGYPENGPLNVQPASIEGSLSALGRDIYNDHLETRTLLVVSANVRPGNSGSPLFVDHDVVGVIFSRSTDQSLTGYAIPSSQVIAALSLAHRGISVSTQSCVAN